jgi:uncharacterized coiled-coil protein SlyX
MAAWYALAASYLPDIIKLALPLFTRGRPQEKTPEVMAQQITELQSAALQNADSIKLMATEMQKTIEALQAAPAMGAAAGGRRLPDRGARIRRGCLRACRPLNVLLRRRQGALADAFAIVAAQ